MDRATLKGYLAQAENHIVLLEEHLADQKTLIDQLFEAGHSELAVEARKLLESLKITQRQLVAQRVRLLRELDHLRD